MDQDAHLLDGARQGNQTILAEIYNLYSPEIYRYAWRLLGNEDVAEECVADIFSRFLRTLKNGHGPKNYLRAYLYRVVHNWVHDYWLKMNKDIELDDIDQLILKQSSPEDGLSNQQDFILVHEALNQLTPDQRSVIVLKYLEEMDNAEIARILRKPIGAVKALQNRGLNSLRKLLAKHDNSKKIGNSSSGIKAESPAF